MPTPTQTLLAAIGEHDVDCTTQASHGPTNNPREITLRTEPLAKVYTAEPHPIYKTIRAVLEEHAIDGEGLAGGAVEVYPLKDGRTFTVTWIGGERSTPQSAILNIAPMGKAY